MQTSSVLAFIGPAAVLACVLFQQEAAAFAPAAVGKLSLRPASATAQAGVPNFLRLAPKLRAVTTPLKMAISDEAQISTSGGAGGFFT